MKHSSSMKPRAILFAAALFLAVAAPLTAQQPTGGAPVRQAAAPPVSAPTGPLTGPRVRPVIQPAHSVGDSFLSPVSSGDNHTIVISTLVLVLAVVILVLLIAR